MSTDKANENFDALLENIRRSMDQEAQMVKAYYDVLKFNGLPEPLVFQLVIGFQSYLWNRKA